MPLSDNIKWWLLQKYARVRLFLVRFFTKKLMRLSCHTGITLLMYDTSWDGTTVARVERSPWLTGQGLLATGSQVSLQRLGHANGLRTDLQKHNKKFLWQQVTSNLHCQPWAQSLTDPFGLRGFDDLFFLRMLCLIQAVSQQKLPLQFLHAIPLFTHNSCVMSTICQSSRACRDDFQQLLPSIMDWHRLFQTFGNEPSIRWNKVLARSHKQKKKYTNIQPLIAFIRLMTGCNLTPTKDSWSITNHNSISNCHECPQVLIASMPLSCHGQSQQKG